MSAEALRGGGVALAGSVISGVAPGLPKKYRSDPSAGVAVREAQTDTCLAPVLQWNTATSAVEQNDPGTVGPARVTASARTLAAVVIWAVTTVDPRARTPSATRAVEGVSELVYTTPTVRPRNHGSPATATTPASVSPYHVRPMAEPPTPHAENGAPAPASASVSAPATAAPAAVPLRVWPWRVLGVSSVSIGVINAFIPLLPSTVFLLIGAWAFSRGAPHWRERLMAHPRFGAPLRNWADGGRVSKRGKRLAAAGMAASVAISLWFYGPTVPVLAVAAGLTGLAAWLWTRPEPRAE